MWNANKCIRNRFGKRSYGWFIHKNRNRSFCASLDRWLLSQGQTDRAVSILRTFARINKKQVDESVYENLKVIDSLLRVWSVLLCNTSILFHHSAGQKEKKQKQKHHIIWSRFISMLRVFLFFSFWIPVHCYSQSENKESVVTVYASHVTLCDCCLFMVGSRYVCAFV